ncbi:MAG: TlpA family protein disulfide reductase [Opitutaceae bacterium]|nr:TlpA family protein disulfide reductase [Opitutaceae bacterium]
MRFLHPALACATLFAFASPISLIHAQTPPAAAPAKSPADLAYEAYTAIRNAKDAKPGQARNSEVLKAGVDFILAYPAHSRTSTVIGSVAGFATSTMSGNANAPARAAYLTAAKFELLGQRKREDLTPDQALALASLDVALSGALAREERSRDSETEFREKIDTLSKMPKADRFLSGHLRDLGEYIRTLGRPEMAVQYYQKLVDHKDKKVVDMAKLELRLLDARMTPAPFTFTSTDGKPVDFAQLRGKAVLIVYWSPTHEASSNAQIDLKELYRNYRRQGLEVVGVACNKEADKAKLDAFLKSKKLPWPTYYDGKEFASDIAQRFNVRSVPNAVLLGKDGAMIEAGIAPNRYEGMIKRVLGIK